MSNQSTIYAALDKLAAEDLVRGIEQRSPTGTSETNPPRHRRVHYEATARGQEMFYTWLTAPAAQVEPVRAEIFLKIGLATQSHALPLIDVIDAQIDACADALARHMAGYGLNVTSAAVRWDLAASWLINEAAITRLQADLSWLRRVRAAAESLRQNGFVPASDLAPAHGTVPAGWG